MRSSIAHLTHERKSQSYSFVQHQTRANSRKIATHMGRLLPKQGSIILAQRRTDNESLIMGALFIGLLAVCPLWSSVVKVDVGDTC